MNVHKMMKKIDENGYLLSELAELMDIEKESLFRKLTNLESLTIKEANKLKIILGLTTLEALEIFFER